MKTQGWLGVSLAAAVALATQSAAAAGPLSAYGGSWRGAGSLDSGGQTEPLRCRSDNQPSQGGRAIALSLACASDSFRIEIRSDLTSDGETVQGSWTETTQNVSGEVSGAISRGTIKASVTGPGVDANVVIRVAGRRLDFALASQQGNVQVELRR